MTFPQLDAFRGQAGTTPGLFAGSFSRAIGARVLIA
jgi:hypothetical protein